MNGDERHSMQKTDARIPIGMLARPLQRSRSSGVSCYSSSLVALVRHSELMQSAIIGRGSFTSLVSEQQFNSLVTAALASLPEGTQEILMLILESDPENGDMTPSRC